MYRKLFGGQIVLFCAALFCIIPEAAGDVSEISGETAQSSGKVLTTDPLDEAPECLTIGEEDLSVVYDAKMVSPSSGASSSRKTLFLNNVSVKLPDIYLLKKNSISLPVVNFYYRGAGTVRYVVSRPAVIHRNPPRPLPPFPRPVRHRPGPWNLRTPSHRRVAPPRSGVVRSHKNMKPGCPKKKIR